MPSNNFKIFDENKSNMLTDESYSSNTQRQNGVQLGVASSQLQNKFQYQTSIMVKALADFMVSRGYDALDSDVYSTFASNLASALTTMTFGSTDPTTSTVGFVGQLRLTTVVDSAGEYRLWQCVKIAGNVYTWQRYVTKAYVDTAITTAVGNAIAASY